MPTTACRLPPPAAYHLPPTTACRHLPPAAAYHLPLPAAPGCRHHLPPPATTCHHLPPPATTCHQLPPPGTTCHHLPPPATITRPLSLTTCHLLLLLLLPLSAATLRHQLGAATCYYMKCLCSSMFL